MDTDESYASQASLEAIAQRLEELEESVKGAAKVPGRARHRPKKMKDETVVSKSSIAQTNATAVAEIPEDARIAVRLADEIIHGVTVRRFLASLVERTVQRGWLTEEHLPMRIGKKRYFVARDPLHPSGKSFYSPEAVGDLYVETNEGFLSASRKATLVADALGCDCEVLRVKPTSSGAAQAQGD